MIALKDLRIPEVVQSPMANCTDLPFRLIARSVGMRLAFLEMISAETLVHNNKATFSKMQTEEADRPVGVQLVGCDPHFMGEAAAQVEGMGFPVVDLNLGCPVPKVVSKGGGSELLREPEKARSIFSKVVRSVKKIPVTVKMRIGFEDKTGREAVEIARIAQDCGVSAVAVHGRTRVQGYAGNADYEAIRRIKEAVSIPVLGNGDVVDAQSALRLKEISGCDGILIGRGALGNPWIYREIQAALAGETLPPEPTTAQRRELLLKHIELQCQYEPRPVGPLRRIICWYFKDRPGAPQFRHAIHYAQTVDEMRDLIQENF